MGPKTSIETKKSFEHQVRIISQSVRKSTQYVCSGQCMANSADGGFEKVSVGEKGRGDVAVPQECREPMQSLNEKAPILKNGRRGHWTCEGRIVEVVLLQARAQECRVPKQLGGCREQLLEDTILWVGQFLADTFDALL